MCIAVIDLGTNTFNLLIAGNDNGKLKILYADEEPVMLGEKTITQNFIGDAATERAIHRLLIYKDICKQYHVTQIYAVGTSAIREAVNKAEFISTIKERTDIDLEVISGDREAELICKGVHSNNDFSGRTLILDIGGGSNEYILAENGKPVFMQSYKQGATRLKSQVDASDPMSEHQVKEIENILSGQLDELKQIIQKNPVDSLIGSAGSFVSLSAMLNNGTEQAQAYKFNQDQYFNLHNFLLTSTRSQRMELQGLPSMRLDLVVIASIIINFSLKNFNINSMYLSHFAMKEGYAYEKLIEQQYA